MLTFDETGLTLLRSSVFIHYLLYSINYDGV